MAQTGRGAGRLGAGVADAFQTKDANRVAVDPLMIQCHINADQLQGQQPKYIHPHRQEPYRDSGAQNY